MISECYHKAISENYYRTIVTNNSKILPLVGLFSIVTNISGEVSAPIFRVNRIKLDKFEIYLVCVWQ